MKQALKIAAMLLAAMLLGLVSVQAMLRDGRAQANGPWRIWASRVAPANSPYTLSHFFKQSRLPPDTSQTAIFMAGVDSEGRALSGACSYMLSGAMPPSRWWSLALEDGSAALTSGRVILEADGNFTARISAAAEPGNWLPLPDRGSFRLMLTFHGPQGLLKEAPARASLPQIRKGAC